MADPIKFTIGIETYDPELVAVLANVALMIKGERVDIKSALDTLCLVADSFFDVYGATDKDKIDILGLIRSRAELLDGRPTTKIT